MFWINKKPKEIAALYKTEYGETVSNRQVKLLLRDLGYGYRKQSKQLATGTCAQRDQQFQIIMTLALAMSVNSPVISIDCKKKERLGQLYRDGKCYTQAPLEVFDHDYEHLSEGKIIPHGIYDLQANEGYISIGNSAETAAFIVDNLRWWWNEYGKHRYPTATNILVFCDAGGGNSYRHHIFKQRLLELSKELGMTFIICHYPPYASKWNPIEHRLFCHVHQAMSGFVFSDYDIVKQRIEQTTTKTGLKVFVRIHLQEYPTGINGDPNVKHNSRISYHPELPKLSYRISP